jgi:hypothetical protein
MRRIASLLPSSLTTRCSALIAVPLLLLLLGAQALADVRVSYTVDEKALKTAVAGTNLAFALFSDNGCTTQVGGAVQIAVEDVLIQRLKLLRPKGATKPPKTDEIHATLTGVTAAPYLKVIGNGITAVGGDCQLQPGGGGTSLPCASQVGSEVYFDSCNVNIRSGTGGTDGTINGLGNLVVGYNERMCTFSFSHTATCSGDADCAPNTCSGGGCTSSSHPCTTNADCPANLCSPRTGSHNIVTGRGNSYTSYGGVVAGWVNSISGPYTSVTGGRYNSATEEGCSVSGGSANLAGSGTVRVDGPPDVGGIGSVNDAAVSGGIFNAATDYEASVSGGFWNSAKGQGSSISGGYHNMASGGYSWIGGGFTNITSGSTTSVCGGDGNSASATSSTVSGGQNNIASNDYAVVSGGYANTASGVHAAISGGKGGTATGEAASVSGGSGNSATGNFASVSGGLGNLAGPGTPSFPAFAAGYAPSVSGGYRNQASAAAASVSGGGTNTATGDTSTVSGGRFNIASGVDSCVAGGDSNSARTPQSCVSGGFSNVTFDGGTAGRNGIATTIAGGKLVAENGDTVWAVRHTNCGWGSSFGLCFP